MKRGWTKPLLTNAQPLWGLYSPKPRVSKNVAPAPRLVQGAQGQEWSVVAMSVRGEVEAELPSTHTTAEQHRDGDAGLVSSGKTGEVMGVVAQRAQAASAR